MARIDYTSADNIHAMNARQLRDYIYVKSREAEQRLASIDLDTASRAFKDAVSDITYKGGERVIKSTSNLSKEEMRELAYKYRQFESLDVTSSFAKSIEWKENKQKYETFIRNQTAAGSATKDYWSKYITPKGNVSKKGYEEYKKYLQFLRNMTDIIEQYDYEMLKKYYKQAEGDPKLQKKMEELLITTYMENKEKGISQEELNNQFYKKWNDYLTDYKQNKAKQPSVKKPSVKKPAAKKPKKAPASKQTIKAKQGGKMRTSAKVSEKLT